MTADTHGETRPTCHVVTHVHWDREWYRPFEGYRSRLLELVTRVCDAVDSGELRSFHLDGQTIIVADVAALRPDLAARLRALIEDGRVSIGPWHVLADNQLVSAENLLRNLFLARRVVGPGLGSIGYSPDAFGHPADLPRILNGFGIDTALVWRGAPPEHARFRWRSADGSEVFAVNQAYHQAEVLWDAAEAGGALAGFLDGERARLADGPWLLLNGGDHLYPVPPRERAEALAWAGPTAVMRESTLAEFFAAAQDAAGEPALVEGELRHLGDRLTFLLPGTLSARSYTKRLNDRAQALLERFVEPALAVGRLDASPAGHGPGSARALLDHAWDLLVQNAPHDSICGCSVDEVHRQTTVRAERVLEIGDQLVRRAGLDAGLDTRGQGRPASDAVRVLVRSADGDVASAPVVVDVVTAADRYVTGLLAPDGTPVAVEAEHLGPAQWFEADLDLLPDTSRGSRHRLAFTASDLPPFGWAVYTAVLGPQPACAPQSQDGCRDIIVDGVTIRVDDDASVTVTTADGVSHDGLGALVDGGDRGDSYTYDPPAADHEVRPRVRTVMALTSPVRSRLVVQAVLEAPRSLTDDRDARSPRTVELPLTVVVERWTGDPAVRWTVDLDNTAHDHRLRWHAPVVDDADGPLRTWHADTHWSVQERPFTPVVGTLPAQPALEAPIGTSPAHTYAVAGSGDRRVAVLLDALPEVQGVVEGAGVESTGASLAVTLLRAVGWLSRFDLRTRTTGAGPAFEVPEAQCEGPLTARLAILLGAAAADELTLARAAARHHTPPWATQLRGASPAPAGGTAPRVQGALVSALKPAEVGDGVVLRVSNPTSIPRTAWVGLPPSVHGVREVRLDESPLGALPPGEPTHAGKPRRLELELGAYGVRTLHLTVAPER